MAEANQMTDEEIVAELKRTAGVVVYVALKPEDEETQEQAIAILSVNGKPVYFSPPQRGSNKMEASVRALMDVANAMQAYVAAGASAETAGGETLCVEMGGSDRYIPIGPALVARIRELEAAYAPLRFILRPPLDRALRFWAVTALASKEDAAVVWSVTAEGMGDDRLLARCIERMLTDIEPVPFLDYQDPLPRALYTRVSFGG